MDEPFGPRPWVGKKYQAERLGLRLLIVGESHYGAQNQIEDKSFTEATVQERRDELKHGRFFGVVEQICVGRKLLVADVHEFWDRVSFVNYASSLVVDGISAADRHFEGSQTRLKYIVEELEPDLV